MKWLFLVHQVRSPNSRERVKVWRLIKRTGAILYRNSVYVLPYDKERLEDLQWVCQQIRDSEGEASVFVTESGDPEENREIRARFRAARQEDYASLQQTAERLLGRVTVAAGKQRLSDSLVREFSREARQLRQAFDEVSVVDFFSQSPPRSLAQMIEKISKQLVRGELLETPAAPIKTRDRKDYQKKLWTTRERIHIDRLSSAWLIKRFIDPRAKFVFAPEGRLPTDTVSFDVLGAEFSHHGEDCTFETLLKAFRIKGAALRAIGEIVHDVDLKDRKFDRPEAAGIDAVIRALADSINDDHRLLEIGSGIFDALYQLYSRK